VGAGRTGERAEPGPDSPIPDKLYFKIGEVAQLVGVQAHVLRYWEKEVPALRPGKSASNQRRYRRKDVEIFREIKRLLHQERYTLAGARRRIMTGDTSRDDGATVLGNGDGEVEISTVVAKEPQLGLRFPRGSDAEAGARLRQGLVELIQLAGEEP
jgi:DNA-binding transcriptional MerR regulator